MHRGEVQLRTSLLGEPAKHVRPLSETRFVSTSCVAVVNLQLYRAIDSGANALAEGFLFGVAAVLILGETYRSSRNQSKRRDDVDDKLEELGTQVSELTQRVSSLSTSWEEREIEHQIRCVSLVSFPYTC